MNKLFSGEKAGGYTAEQLHKIHERLIAEKELKSVHFDYFIESLTAALSEVGLSVPLMEEVHSHLKPFRSIFEQATTQYSMSREERLFFALDDDADGSLPEGDLIQALSSVGLGPGDKRLAELYERLDINQGLPLNQRSFSQIVGSAGLLVERAFQGTLVIPDFEDFSRKTTRIFDDVKLNTSGIQAQYIPPLAEAEPERFGVAIVTIDGQVFAHGDHEMDFSIQSMCKPFNYCFAVEELGAEHV